MSNKTELENAPEMRRLAAKAEMVKALAHPLRLGIVEFLAGGERCVCEIAEWAGSERSNVSRHLALMVRSGVLANRKQGLQVYYRLRCPCVVHFLDCATNLLNERINDEMAMVRLLDGSNSPQKRRVRRERRK